MVQLKRRRRRLDAAPAAALPCLKGHGPIEAPISSDSSGTGTTLPCLKGHGPIEARSYHSTPVHRTNLPCLKGYGPIELNETARPLFVSEPFDQAKHPSKERRVP